MNGTNRGAIRAYAAFSNDLIDLIVKDYPLDLFEDPFPILEAQPDPVWAGHPVWSRNAVKLMSALLPVVEGSFDCNPYVHGSPPYKELTLAQARSPTTTPMFCPLPATSGDYRHWVNVQGRRLSHTMDPRRGAPLIAPPASVTVVARTCAEADAWATALMVLGAERGADLARQRGLDALFLLRDDEGNAMGVGVGRLFSEEPAAIASAGGR